MATMGVKMIGDGGAGFGKLGQTLADALFGNAETEMKMARLRQDYDTEAWRRRVLDAQEAASRASAANQQAAADTENYQRQTKQAAADVIAEQQAGLREPPVPVEITPATTHTELSAPVEDTPYGRFAAGQSVAPPLPGGAQVPMQSLDAEPAPIDLTTPFGVMGAGARTAPALPGDLWPPMDAAPQDLPPVDMPVPVETPAVMGVRPEDQAAYDRDVAAIRARVKAAMAMGSSAKDIAEGMGVSEGMVRMLSEDPKQQRIGTTLYTGSNPSDKAAAAPGTSPYLKEELDMRKQIEGLDAYKKLSAVVPVYLSMAKTAGGPLDNAAVMDLVYGLATAEDPGSVVREADSLQVKRIGGLSGEVQALVGYVTGGQPITPEVVEQIMRIAKNRVGSYAAAYEHQAKDYRDIATRSGYDVRNAVPTFPELDEYKPPLPPGVTEEQVQKYATDHNLPLEQARKILLQRGGQ